MGGLVLLIGRIVFSFFFIYSGFNHLTKLSTYAQYAGASGVPAPTLLTAVSLVTAAFTVHKFWGIADPMMAGNQAAHFWKNISLTGACLMFYGLATLNPARWPFSLGRESTSSASG